MSVLATAISMCRSRLMCRVRDMATETKMRIGLVVGGFVVAYGIWLALQMPAEFDREMGLKSYPAAHQGKR